MNLNWEFLKEKVKMTNHFQSVQHSWQLWKCKLKLLWDIILCQSEKLPSRKQIASNACVSAVKRNPHSLLVWLQTGVNITETHVKNPQNSTSRSSEGPSYATLWHRLEGRDHLLLHTFLYSPLYCYSIDDSYEMAAISVSSNWWLDMILDHNEVPVICKEKWNHDIGM